MGRVARWGTWLWGIGCAMGCVGCGPHNPHVISSMPAPAQQVLNTPTLTGNTIGDNILDATGNQGFVGTGQMPGYYSVGPAGEAANGAYYVDFEIPVNLPEIRRQLGYLPHPIPSTTEPGEVYLRIQPLPNQAYDRLYFTPDNDLAVFAFKVNANGSVMDESWDAVDVNS